MAVREFEEGEIDVEVGLVNPPAATAFTTVALIWFHTPGTSEWVWTRNGAGSEAQKWTSFGRESGTFHYYPTSSGPSSEEPIPPSGEWLSVVAVQPADETPPTFYWWRHSIRKMVTAVAEVGGPPANEGVPTRIQIGRWNTAEQFRGKIADLGVYDGAFTKLEAEKFFALRSIEGWLGFEPHTPLGLWDFRQESVEEPVLDLTGNGADQISQSGTLVVPEEAPIPLEHIVTEVQGASFGDGTAAIIDESPPVAARILTPDTVAIHT